MLLCIINVLLYSIRSIDNLQPQFVGISIGLNVGILM